MIKLSYYSLPNLLAGKKVVPEIIQDEVSPEILGAEVLSYLDNPEKCHALVDSFEAIHKSLKQGTNKKAATAVIDLVKR